MATRWQLGGFARHMVKKAALDRLKEYVMKVAAIYVVESLLEVKELVIAGFHVTKYI